MNMDQAFEAYNGAAMAASRAAELKYELARLDYHHADRMETMELMRVEFATIREVLRP